MGFEISENPDLTEHMPQIYLRSICNRLFTLKFSHSSTYGTYFLIDNLTRTGGRVYMVALNKRYKPIDRWLGSRSILYDLNKAAAILEKFACTTKAAYLIVAKVGNIMDYTEELAVANTLYESVKSAKLYDYMTLEEYAYRSYMENLR